MKCCLSYLWSNAVWCLYLCRCLCVQVLLRCLIRISLSAAAGDCRSSSLSDLTEGNKHQRNMQSRDTELSTLATSPDTCLQPQLFMDIRFSPEARERDMKPNKTDTPLQLSKCFQPVWTGGKKHRTESSALKILEMQNKQECCGDFIGTEREIIQTHQTTYKHYTTFNSAAHK